MLHVFYSYQFPYDILGLRQWLKFSGQSTREGWALQCWRPSAHLQVILQNPENFSTLVPSDCHFQGMNASTCGNHSVHLVCYPLLRDQCPLLPDVLCLQTNFHIFCSFCFSDCFRWDYKSNSILKGEWNLLPVSILTLFFCLINQSTLKPEGRKYQTEFKL